MITFKEFRLLHLLESNLIDDFHKSCSSEQLRSYSKRDNCGPAALDFIDHHAKNGVKLTRVRGNFVADHAVHDKNDFTPDMKKEFYTTNKDFNNKDHRKEFIENHPKYKEEWKKIPHYWTKDEQGNIHDPSGHSQFIKSGLSKDLDKSRYEES